MPACSFTHYCARVLCTLAQHEQCTRGSGQQSDSASDGGNTGTGVGHRVLVAVAGGTGLVGVAGLLFFRARGDCVGLDRDVEGRVTPR